VLVPTSQGLRRGQPRARARQSVATAASCSGSYQPYSVLDGRNDSERRSIHGTTRCHVAGRRYFAEPPLDGLKPGSPGAARLSDSTEPAEVLALPIAKRGYVARIAPFRKDLRPTK